MSFQKGTVKRTKPVLIVNNGYDPMSPQSAHRQLRLPVAAADVSVIKSGMVISPAWNATGGPDGAGSYEWVAGIPASDVVAEQIAFANADGDDYDIVAASGLPGLLCSGIFDLTTGYFANEITGATFQNYTPVAGAAAVAAYNSGVYLTPCTTTDAGKDSEGAAQVAGQLRGYLKPADLESGEPIVGVVHGSMRGAFSLGPTATGSGASADDAGMTPGQNSSASELNVIRFITRLSVNPTDAGA